MASNSATFAIQISATQTNAVAMSNNLRKIYNKLNNGETVTRADWLIAASSVVKVISDVGKLAEASPALNAVLGDRATYASLAGKADNIISILLDPEKNTGDIRASDANNGVRSCLLPFNLKYPPCPDPYVLNSPVLYTT